MHNDNFRLLRSKPGICLQTDSSTTEAEKTAWTKEQLGYLRIQETLGEKALQKTAGNVGVLQHKNKVELVNIKISNHHH